MSMFNSLESEKTVVGILLTYGGLEKVSGFLRHEHFSSEYLGGAYRAILDLDLAGDGYDIGAVLSAVKKNPGAREVLVDACEYATTKTTLNFHAGKIVDAWKLRKGADVCGAFGLEDISDVDSYIAEKAEELSKITQGYASNIASWEDSLNAAKAEMFSPISDKRLKIGFSRCDSILGGVDPGDYVIIAARPSVGKSAFATNIVINLANNLKKILFVSLEMPKQQIIERMTAMLGNVPLDEIRARVASRGPEADVEKENIESAVEFMKNWRIHLHDYGKITPRGIHALIRANRYDVVVIDHIGLMSPDSRAENRVQEVAQISRALRMIAMQTGVQIFALSQLNRASEGRSEKRVLLSDLKDSGSLEQDATAVIGLSPMEDGNILLEVLKNRNGRCGNQIMSFDGPYMRFSEIEERYEKPRIRGYSHG